MTSLEAERAYRKLVVLGAELAGCLPVHSAYIPGLATSGGFWWHTAAQPFRIAGSFCQVSAGMAWW